MPHWQLLQNLITVKKYKMKAFGQDQCSSRTINSILLLFLLFLVSSRVVIFKNFSSYLQRTLQAVDFFLYLPQKAHSLLKNNLLFKFPLLLTRQRLNTNPITTSSFSSASHALYVELDFTKIYKYTADIENRKMTA